MNVGPPQNKLFKSSFNVCTYGRRLDQWTLALKTNFWFGNKERNFRKESIKIRKTAKFACEML